MCILLPGLQAQSHLIINKCFNATQYEVILATQTMEMEGADLGNTVRVDDPAETLDAEDDQSHDYLPLPSVLTRWRAFVYIR